MSKFIVTVHHESEEVIEIEADSAAKAERLVLDENDGVLLDYYILGNQITDIVDHEESEDWFVAPEDEDK